MVWAGSEQKSNRMENWNSCILCWKTSQLVQVPKLPSFYVVFGTITAPQVHKTYMQKLKSLKSLSCCPLSLESTISSGQRINTTLPQVFTHPPRQNLHAFFPSKSSQGSFSLFIFKSQIIFGILMVSNVAKTDSVATWGSIRNLRMPFQTPGQ